MIKHKKALLLALAALLVFFAAILQIARISIHSRSFNRAADLAEQGCYAQSVRLLEKLPPDMESRGLAALHRHGEELMVSGLFHQANSLFSALSGYSDSAELEAACRWEQSIASGDTAGMRAALSAFTERNSSPALDAARRQICQALFDKALELAKSGAFHEAGSIWEQLGNWGDSPILSERAGKAALYSSAGEDERLLRETRRFMPDRLDVPVYSCDSAYIVAPQGLSSDAKFFIYFPGGRDAELSLDYLLYYLMDPSRDTLAVFMRRNGLTNMEEKALEAAELLQQASAELGLFPRELVTAGSSLGAYPAMQSVLPIYDRYRIYTDCVLSLDAGSDWEEAELLLSRESCLRTAELGTSFYLFESPWLGMNREGIVRMVECGNDVTMVGCVYDDHVRISLDAMGMGIVDWAVHGHDKALNDEMYTLRRLSQSVE